MEVNNTKYKHQGIHVIASIFTIDKGMLKVLLIKRKNKPFQGSWALTGGALYNDEDLEDGLRREIYEKTGLKNIELKLSNVFGKKDRSPVMRMVAITYIGMVDITKVKITTNTLKTSDAIWCSINEIPLLAYDHNEIIKDAISNLKELVLETNILKVFFPQGFTLPELQKIYEEILGKKLDRRNFRKKLFLQKILLVQNKKKISKVKRKQKYINL